MAEETTVTRLRSHPESHLVSRIGWLRAAVLGANDGIVSTASLIVGVAAASAATSDVLIAGVAGLVAGAMSMAAGEYVSVSSQSDTEQADLTRERAELATQPEFEREELARIYVERGVYPTLARQVAAQLMAKDVLGAHARDELGISEITTARPVQAALDVGSHLRGRDGTTHAPPHSRRGCFDRVARFSCPAWCNRCPGRWGERR
jgi:VIT1/CCC1 family predicted Fe2+/Mn2+ transporter